MAGPAGTWPLPGPLHLTALLLLLLLLTPLLASGVDHPAPNNVVKRAADIVIVLDGGEPERTYPARGLDLPCTHHVNCTPYVAICRSDTKRCDCASGYKRHGHLCMYIGNNSPDSIAIYQVTLVVAAVFMVLVFSVFVGCVVKRTCERSRDLAERMRELSMDVYTVPAEFEGLERPPSYTDIVKIDHMVYGVPPPEYSAACAPPEPQEEPPPPLPPPRTLTLSSAVRQAASRRRAPPPPVPVHAPNSRPAEDAPSVTDGGGASTT
ncbi:uncharacterized protein LOC144098864 isoform X2 [Amblyomma americanum]